MQFADIHIHALYGADDGPESEQEMYRLVQAAYDDGTRVMCLTPHFHLGYFGDNREKVHRAYAQLLAYAREHMPDLQLYLGNELRSSDGSTQWLRDRLCATLNDTNYVLVDFSEDEKPRSLMRGINDILRSGYVPVLGHAERYRHLSVGQLREVKESGAWLQVNAQSLTGGNGLRIRLRAWELLKTGLADMVASDAHSMDKRPPQLSGCYDKVVSRCGKQYADRLFWENAVQLLQEETENE